MYREEMPQTRKTLQITLYTEQAVQRTAPTFQDFHTVNPICPIKLTPEAVRATNQASIHLTEQTVEEFYTTKHVLHPTPKTRDVHSLHQSKTGMAESRPAIKTSARPYTCSNRCNEKKRPQQKGETRIVTEM